MQNQNHNPCAVFHDLILCTPISAYIYHCEVLYLTTAEEQSGLETVVLHKVI